MIKKLSHGEFLGAGETTEVYNIDLHHYSDKDERREVKISQITMRKEREDYVTIISTDGDDNIYQSTWHFLSRKIEKSGVIWDYS